MDTPLNTLPPVETVVETINKFRSGTLDEAPCPISSQSIKEYTQPEGVVEIIRNWRDYKPEVRVTDYVMTDRICGVARFFPSLHADKKEECEMTKNLFDESFYEKQKMAVTWYKTVMKRLLVWSLLAQKRISNEELNNYNQINASCSARLLNPLPKKEVKFTDGIKEGKKHILATLGYAEHYVVDLSLPSPPDSTPKSRIHYLKPCQAETLSSRNQLSWALNKPHITNRTLAYNDHLLRSNQLTRRAVSNITLSEIVNFSDILSIYFRIYSDGSLYRPDPPLPPNMGFGWLLTSPNKLLMMFFGRLDRWASSTK
ncbi:hypothetical protein GLOIN_2v1867489 [Rhizophagus irregularis DAOM 181602=DAOM 197198]|nr:hypothetical protein GLOIN_2v1867489 [Rhizophagus irregularis DAOM 181602=DAOM 197198]